MQAREFPWYPYDSFATFEILDGMLRGPIRGVVDNPKGTVLDIGCADGDLAFFFESLGFRVVAVDYPATNQNGMRGVRMLKEHLNSNVEIITADLDSRFELPPQPFDLALVLGLLYHLKNPYYLLESLAQRARFCLLTTRVARRAPDGTNMRDSPVAYLLEPDELNQDPTNYWIFSEAGLKRLLRRTGWEICSYQTLGDIQASTPATLEHDERAFCVLRSRLRTDPSANARLLEGWYKVEEDHWRWTARVFSVECAAPAHGAGAVLELRFLYPERLYQRTASLEIKTSLAGLPLGTQQFSRPGEHLYQAAVPAAMLRESFVPITFELSHAIPPDGTDLAERSIIVLNVGLL